MVVNRLYLHRGLFIAFSLSYLEFYTNLCYFLKEKFLNFNLEFLAVKLNIATKTILLNSDAKSEVIKFNVNMCLSVYRTIAVKQIDFDTICFTDTIVT